MNSLHGILTGQQNKFDESKYAEIIKLWNDTKIKREARFLVQDLKIGMSANPENDKAKIILLKKEFELR